MRQKFTITEADRKHIKKLYEQGNSNQEKQLEVNDDHIGMSIAEYVIFVGVKDDYENDSVRVTVVEKGDENERLVIGDIDNFSDNLSDEEVTNYVNGLIQSGYFNKLPIYMSYDMRTGRLDADIPRDESDFN